MARVCVVAEVVRSYIELRSEQRRLALQRENLRDQNRLVAMTRDRRNAGIVSDLEIDRSLTSASVLRHHHHHFSVGAILAFSQINMTN